VWKHLLVQNLRRNVTVSGAGRCRHAHEERVVGGDQADPLVPGVQEGVGATGVGATRVVVVELNEDVVEEFGGDGFAEIGDWVCGALRRCRQVKVTPRRLSEEVEFPGKVVPVILRRFDVEVDAVERDASQWTILATEEAVVEIVSHLLCVLRRAQRVE